MAEQLQVSGNLNSFLKEGYNLIDTRPPSEYLDGTLKNALFFPPNMIENNQSILTDSLYYPPSRTILIHSNTNTDLAAYNFLDAPYHLPGTYQHFTDADLSTDIAIEVDAEEFSLDYKYDKRIDILDIRPHQSFNQLHLQRALSIPFKEVLSVLPELEITTDLYVIGDDLDEILFVTSLLRANGFFKARPVTSTISELLKTELSFIRKAKGK